MVSRPKGLGWHTMSPITGSSLLAKGVTCAGHSLGEYYCESYRNLLFYSRWPLCTALIIVREDNATTLVAKLGRFGLLPMFITTILESLIELVAGDDRNVQQNNLTVLLGRTQRRRKIIKRKTAAVLKPKMENRVSLCCVDPSQRTERRSEATNGASKNVENANFDTAQVIPLIADLLERRQSFRTISVTSIVHKIAIILPR